MEPVTAREPILPVVLAGGEGARLKPVSTSENPKPFIPLPDGRSLLTRTLERLRNPLFLPPVLVGHENHRFALLNHARAAGIEPQAILLEPKAANTAMAIACAASYALTYAPGAVLAILPADQVIEPLDRWLDAIRAAAEASEVAQTLCLLGITPTRPDSNFGYIELGVAQGAAHAVDSFIEKPAKPEMLPASCVWNAGQFIVPARVIEALMLEHAPETWMAAQHAVASITTDWEFLRLGRASYAGLPGISFDRAVVEHAPSLCVRLNAHWHDLGTLASWEALSGQPASFYLARPKRTDRPWGYFEEIARAPERIEKRLTLFPGSRLSLQRHHHRSESWKVLQGEALVELEGVLHALQPGDEIQIGRFAWHRLSNPASATLIMHEIQFGQPDERDIERREDDYGRNAIQCVANL